MLYHNNHDEFKAWLVSVKDNYEYCIISDYDDTETEIRVRFNPYSIYKLYCDGMLDEQFSDDLEASFEMR